MNEDSAGRIKGIIASGDIVLFMKSVAAAPQCGIMPRAIGIQVGHPAPGRTTIRHPHLNGHGDLPLRRLPADRREFMN